MAEKALVDKYAKPHHVNDVVLAFPGDLGDLLPPQELIPREFWSTPGPDGWCSWASEWFFRGLAKFPEARAGIDENEAIRHLSAILKSFQPSHEHKEAAVAWLASRWLVAEQEIEVNLWMEDVLDAEPVALLAHQTRLATTEEAGEGNE